MKEEDRENQRDATRASQEGVSRRRFLQSAGLIVGSGVVGSFVACAPSGTDGGTDGQSGGQAETELMQPTHQSAELPIPENVAAPQKTSFECDILVVGAGFAGLSAAVNAKKTGKTVVLVDKGTPGYSGLSPWPSSHRWFDAQFGDDAQAFKDCMVIGSEYLGNADWYQVWIDESKEAYEQLTDLGLLTRYPRAVDSGHWETMDFFGYRENFAQEDRHPKFLEILDEQGIEHIEQTMIVDVLENEGKIVGALGFHVPSGAVVTVNAKAVILATGTGSYKPTGFPTGGDSFDGEYIGFQHGLPISGKEFDDFHTCLSWAPGNALPNNSWPWLENIWLCGGDITPDTVETYAVGKAGMAFGRVTSALRGLPNVDGTEQEDQANASISRRGGSLSENPDDPRIGKMVSPIARSDTYGAAIGMGSHLSNGIFCGLDDLVGYTGLPGLYVAGDGTNASYPTGATYPCGVGFTSSFTSIQGKRAADAAAKYADTVSLEPIPEEVLASATEELLAPMTPEMGFDPNWARDELQAIMSPFWVTIVKSEKSLNSTLAQVETLRDSVLPKLRASSSHDLRLCHEVKHKVLSAELKLRTSLFREESRGLHYRADFPYRDDENFLCYITIKKDQKNDVTLAKVPIKDAWKGDLNRSYAERYANRFPGEAEAKGLPVEEEGTSQGSR
jgi:succinate dehydrogenase/fumarate reductase flavoprotein subunit